VLPEHYPHLFASDFVALRQADIPEGYKDHSPGVSELASATPGSLPLKAPPREGWRNFIGERLQHTSGVHSLFLEESGGIARKLAQPPATVLLSLRDKVTASSKMWVVLRFRWRGEEIWQRTIGNRRVSIENFRRRIHVPPSSVQ